MNPIVAADAALLVLCACPTPVWWTLPRDPGLGLGLLLVLLLDVAVTLAAGLMNELAKFVPVRMDV